MEQRARRFRLPNGNTILMIEDWEPTYIVMKSSAFPLTTGRYELGSEAFEMLRRPSEQVQCSSRRAGVQVLQDGKHREIGQRHYEGGLFGSVPVDGKAGRATESR